MEREPLLSERSPSAVGFFKQQIREIPPIVPDHQKYEYLMAERFAAHMLMRARIEDHPTGEEIFEEIIAENEAKGMKRGLAVANAFQKTADRTGLLVVVVKWFYYTKDDPVRAENGMTPAQWLEDALLQETSGIDKRRDRK